MKVFALIFALCIAVSSSYMGGYYQDRYYPRYYGNSLYDNDYGKYFSKTITDYHLNLPRWWHSLFGPYITLYGNHVLFMLVKIRFD